jgi:hypothetical protein
MPRHSSFFSSLHQNSLSVFLARYCSLLRVSPPRLFQHTPHFTVTVDFFFYLHSMAAQYPARRTAAMLIDTEDPRMHNDIDERTYQYLEDVWSSALRRAEEAMHGQADLGAPEDYHSSPAYSSSALTQAEAATSMPPVDATQLSSIPRAAEKVTPSSPLPRAPPLQNRTSPAPPTSASPSLQQKQLKRKPVLQRPVASMRPSWMKVEAQPNLKRNEYTSHRGVAWVVQ